MNIILTHEQTDFDGLASLLGAWMLNERAVPVLPRRINRNVRAFLTLYGVDLPFMDPRDLGKSKIESVCLVDTQSFVSVKGMNQDTQVQVIDHHLARPDLPDDWDVTVDTTGANTTIFVEGIQERGVQLTVVQATLLLLGIYEDTGSLTYTRTTSRDMRAAAYLLEQSANLSIASNFLNHPLSLSQQAIYDQLRVDAEHLNIHGQLIVVTAGDARETNEELSTIAHKLRDFLDADALILLLDIRGGIQLIARSTSDLIDVAKIAAHFGGGGHPRAAASLIKKSTLSEAHTELIEILPEYVQPSITVGEIMSQAPQVLSPDTTVDDALHRMQRYGYEGYPVIDDGKVVGLLTRRAVDRAISHKLNLTASKLMKTGSTHVHPDHSIDHLQQVMTQMDWGQIPVVSRDTGKVIGIVTRTDLLQILAPHGAAPGRTNLANQLEAALPPAWLSLLKLLADLAHQEHQALYIVGGFVRDLLLGHPSLDFDLVVEGDAIKLARAAQSKFGGRITTHKRFGTAKWYLDDIDDPQIGGANRDYPLSTLDFITARTEFYTHPTALPTVERGSIKLDLHRRDFTINTLALRLDGRHYGEQHDYWGGLNDLKKGIIRVLHSLSFVDDPTRMLRAVRYEQRYNFQFSERTLELVMEARPLLDRVSGDRIRHELNNIIDEECAHQIFTRLEALDLLQAIDPMLGWHDWIAEQIAELEPHTPDAIWQLNPDLSGARLKRSLTYILWLISLPGPASERVLKRLRLPRTLTETIRAACSLWPDLGALCKQKPSQITSQLDRIPNLAVYTFYLAAEDEKIRSVLYKYVSEWKQIMPKTTGHDLQELGLPTGPAYRQILSALRVAWLDGEITSQVGETQRLTELIQEKYPNLGHS
ncbi:MAG: CBS domain-containing protein [Chloroflexota bacterium]